MNLTVEPLREGNSHPKETVEVTRQDITKYAGAAGDYSKIHVDEKFATEAGYDSVIAMGMLTAGIAGSITNAWLGLENVRAFDVRFVGIVYPGDVLTYVAEIEEETGGELKGTVTATKSSGETVLTGSVRAHRPE